MSTQDKLPPHSPEMEQAALGSILSAATHSTEEARKMITQLRKSDFYELRNQEVFTALYCLAKSGSSLTELDVTQWLKDKNRLEEAGGLAYVGTLREQTPSEAAFDQQAKILREKAERRELLRRAAIAKEWASDESKDIQGLAHEFTSLVAKIASNPVEPRQWIIFYTPSECRDYVPPDGHVLVGDCHIVKGMTTVIGGAPGVGKSRGADSLAVAGALLKDWFGLKVHRRFKTLIIQNENGRFRLKKEFTEIHGDGLDEHIRVSEPPTFGMAFDKPEFREAIAKVLQDFMPDVVIIDPWNSVARDDKGKDYLEAFQAIREVLPKGDDAPAVVIVAHTRKPRHDERASGRALLTLLAGSHVLGSVPRCAFVMQSASDDPEDQRVIVTCCKNNDGEHGPRSAWYRRNGLFEPCSDFDWKAFDSPPKDPPAKITKEHMETLFQNGNRRLARKAAVTELQGATECGDSAAYDALKRTGRFGKHLSEDDGLLAWKP